MNILHIVPSFYPAMVYGGPIRSLYDLCRALADAGETVRVLTTDANGIERVRAPIGGETSLPTHGGSSVSVLYARRLMGADVSTEFLRALPARVRWADVMHITAIYSFTTLPALLAARISRRRILLSPRGAFGPWGQQRHRVKKAPFNALLRVMARSGVTFHATAESEAADIREVIGDVPVAVVPNGIDTAEFASLPRESGRWLRHAASLKSDDGPLIGCLGRIHRKKGLDRLIAAVPTLLRSWPRIQILLAGPDDGTEQARLYGLATELGVNDRVHFLGGIYSPERISFLAGLDVFVLPSLDENYANAVAEALAAGTPVVASRHCPWPELEERQCGRWVEPEPGRIVSAVNEVLLGDVVAMGRSGREFVLQERNAAMAAGRMQRLYRGAV